MRLVLVLLLAGCKAGRSYPHNGGLVGQLEAEVIALKIQNRQLREDIRSCGEGSQRSETYPTLVQVFQGTEVAIAQHGPRIVLTLPMDFVYADPYTLRVRDEAKREIDLVATALRLNPDQQVEVHGHTDDAMLGAKAARLYRTQLELSYHQAAALAERLIVEHDLAAERFAIVAHGSHEPVGPNETEGGQRANRRLELHLLPPAVE
ncbi:MAG: OmpA family protein [Alphaproteobacteria bacterium]|nr:OmpA family protein [Alphaproteobacteria bacterium]